MALGTGAVTPLQMAGAYAVFANGGYQVQPYLIAKIVDADGKSSPKPSRPARRAQESSACWTRATPSSPTPCCAT
jgi:penicillin-binding protein 1A